MVHPAHLPLCTPTTPAAAHHPINRVINLTIQPAPAEASVHVGFNLNLWNPQLNVASFNKPGIRALFVQSFKNIAPGGHRHGMCYQAIPQKIFGSLYAKLAPRLLMRTCADAIVQAQALPAALGVLVRATVHFPADASTRRAEADALVRVLTGPDLLQMLPEASWKPRLLYTTFPYLVRHAQRTSLCTRLYLSVARTILVTSHGTVARWHGGTVHGVFCPLVCRLLPAAARWLQRQTAPQACSSLCACKEPERQRSTHRSWQHGRPPLRLCCPPA